MSVNSDLPRLNSAGQAALGVTSSFLINGAIHPICTIKNRIMADSQMTILKAIALRGLYSGFWAMFGVDAVAFGAAYVSHDALIDRVSPLTASIVAGLVTAPIVSVGEGLMTNRQVNALPYSQVFCRALRLEGLAVTAFREVPFVGGVFYLSPLLQRRIVQHIPCDKPNTATLVFVQGLAGAVGGAMAGFATSPLDLIKTRIHTNDQSLSIIKTVQSVVAEGGWRMFFRGGGMRSLYLGLAGGGLNVINNTAPHYLPKVLQSKQ